MKTNVRRPLFHGMREVHALWFDLGLIGQAQARARVLRHWQAGARLHQADGGYLLTLARPMLADCAALDGLALCRLDGVLSSAPLEHDERSAVPYGGCWLVRGAQAHAIALTYADQVDPAAWIDLGAIVVHTPLALPAGKAFVALAAPEESKSLRSILDDVIPPPSPRRDAFLRSAKAASQQRPGMGLAGKAGLAALGIAGAALAIAAGIGLAPLFILRLFGGGAGGVGKRGGHGASSASAAPLPSKRGPDSKLKQRLHAALARFTMLTKLSRVIGWRHAQYLRKMLDMLDKGDVAEALRHAIPLDDQADSARQAIGALRARSNLEITAPGGTTSMIGLDPALQQHLREKYRKLFLRLEREGRIDEAAFVLAELLKAGVEAVDYLERNGRCRQAAQLAETLMLAPEITVRLWILAGDATRAVRIARATGAFGDTIRLLERKQDAQAESLRALWADYLVERGDLVEAADAIWPIPAYRSLALTWLLQAERAGRAMGVRALVRKLALMPECLADSMAAIGAVLDDQGDDGAALRSALASELLTLDAHSAATRRLAGEVLRHVIAERGAALNQLSKADINRLVKLADAAMLKSDLPTISFDTDPDKGAALASRATALLAHAGERALLQIHDARRLPGGDYLLALGESGIIRVSARGKQLVHFPLPAYHLVLATNGERALALARRGDVVRASRLDLAACKVSDWLSHPFDSWADQYDGVVWNAVIDNRIVAIDTSKEQLAVIWQVADLPGKVIDFLDDGATQVILMAKADELEQWRYALPSRRMGQRDTIALPAQDVTAVLAHAGSAEPLTLRFTQDAQGCALVVRCAAGRELAVELGHIEGAPTAQVQDGWLLITALLTDGRYRCQVVDRLLSQVVAQLYMPHPNQARVHAHGQHILVFDRSGRLLDVDCATGALRTLSLS